MKKSYIVGIVVIIIVGVGAYFIGMSSGKASAASSAGARGAGFAQFASRSGAASGGAAFARAGAGAMGTFGQIVSVSGSNMVVQIGSSTKIVLLTPTTSIQKTVSGSQSDLTAGEAVTVAGTSNSDGSLTADSIQIRPAGTPSSGTGSRSGAASASQNTRSAPMISAN